MPSVLAKGWLGLGLTVLALVGSAACRSDRPSEPSGEISLSLTGSAGGVTYRLRNARFTITASAGGAQQVLDSETAPDAALLTATLASGMYTINLESGWALERVDTAQVVDATLTSPNPRTFQILTGSTTNLTYGFLTSGGVVTVGTGTLNISISVMIADGGAPDGGDGGCTITPDSCGTGFVCQMFSDAPNMCIHTCDPVTQQRSDGAPACGSANPAAPNLGCYGINGVFMCASVPAPAADRTHGIPAYGPAGGGVYVNGCAAGYLPFFNASSTDSTVVCNAFCQPTPTFQGNGSSGNGLPPHSCADRGAPAGSECRFFSFFSGAVTSVTNMVGVCFDHANFTYDHDSNPATPNVSSPSCTMLSSSDTDGNAIPDYLEWGCGPLAIP